MNPISRTTAATLAAAMLVLAACQEPTSNSELAVANLDHKGKPHGGGGQPTSENKQVTVPTEVRPGVANMIFPDTHGPYDGGVCGVRAC